MEEATNPTPAPEPLTLEQAVKSALQAKGFKPKCVACSSIGWLSFEIFGAPAALPTYLQNLHIPLACLVCKKCGHVSLHSLNAIGVTAQMPEPSLVITPDQVRVGTLKQRSR